MGHSQGGNNNADCQDNAVSWRDWSGSDPGFLRFVQRLVAFRRAHPILRQKRFLHSRERLQDGREDLFWWHPDGRPMTQEDWDDPEARILCAELRMASGTPAHAQREEALFLVFNAGAARPVRLPDPPGGWHWRLGFDSARPERPAGLRGQRGQAERRRTTAGSQGVMAFELERDNA